MCLSVLVLDIQPEQVSSVIHYFPYDFWDKLIKLHCVRPVVVVVVVKESLFNHIGTTTRSIKDIL